jgi:hypothetical protein
MVATISIMMILAGVIGWQLAATRLQQADLADPHPRLVLVPR